MTGKTLGHYKIVSQIGSGGMGAVYLAEDQKLHREVALKVLPPELANNIERFERFQREARSVASLNHPNIVTLFSVEEDAGTHFITMELVRGVSLNRHIPKGGQSVEDFLKTAVPLADALAAAHEKGITHRDLKPANVMIDESGRVKVIDFGLAKAAVGDTSTPDLSQAPTEQLTMEGRIIGTPSYMAPEQVEGKTVDHRTDIFSLGILFHEMLIGERPFKGDSNMSIMSSILKDSPSTVSDLRPDIPVELSRIIRRCLQKNPSERFQSTLDIRNELRELQTEFLTGTLTSFSQLNARGPERKRTGVRKLAVTVAVMVLGVGLWKLPQFLGTGSGGPGRALSSRVVAGEVSSGFPQISRVTKENRLEAMPAWSPDGKRIAFMAPSAGHKHIFIRDLESGVATQLTEGDYDFLLPAWGPDTNTIYYVRGLKEGMTIATGDSVGGYYADEDGQVMRHRLSGGETTVVARQAVYPAVAPGGTNLFFIRNGRVFKSDLMGGRAEQLSSDEDGVTHADLKVSADGTRAVYRRVNKKDRIQHIAVVNTEHMTTLVRTNGFSLYPTWHPSGAYIYFTTYRGAGQNIWRIPMNEDNTAAGDPEPVTVGGGADGEAAFSPDGKRMVFTVSSVNAEVYRVSIDPVTGRTNGPPAEPMPFNSNSEDSRAAWAPDPRQPMVAFNSDRDGDMNLYIWRQADNSVTKVTSGPGGDYQATWSGDLQHLTFFSSRSGNPDVWSVSTNANSIPVQLTDAPGLDVNPFFSPDGKRIVFASDRVGGRGTLFLMNADGSDQHRLVEHARITHFHPWLDKDSIINQIELDGEVRYYRIFADDGHLEPVETIFPIPGIGGHASVSPDGSHLMELNGPHTHIWVIELGGTTGSSIYSPAHPDAMIDYPWWSPDGKWATFDLYIPRNSEIYLAEWAGK